MKISPFGAQLFQADRQTDRQTDRHKAVIVACPKFASGPKNNMTPY